MKQSFLLGKDQLVQLIGELCGQLRVVAPVLNQYGDTLFQEITTIDSIAIDLVHQPQNSVKAFLFPQTEKMSRYTLERDLTTGRDNYRFEACLPDIQPTLYVGVRACDMNAVLYMDKILAAPDRVDPYYERRRRDALFMTLACHAPDENCFCNQTQTGPALAQGYDVQLTDLGTDLFVDVAGSRGQQFVEQWQSFFSPIARGDEQRKLTRQSEAEGQFHRHVAVEKAVQILNDHPTPVAVLEQLAQRCQGCAGCAYVCPTCTCFTINDLKLHDGHGVRQRAWDACTFSGFTKMAGDHNPVQGESQRMTKRFLHKLQHDVNTYGYVSCVGCGRCVDMCFGGVDIVRFINAVVDEDVLLRGEDNTDG